ncbi:MAG: hypothetical protein JRI35_06160 [Deltaproteobacteria bacterium]|nr:hypothetical protein [Deltaproteobacteria bacterium]
MVISTRVSKLTHRRPERQCNPARYPKPRKKANRSCGRARMATSAADHGFIRIFTLKHSGIITQLTGLCNPF